MHIVSAADDGYIPHFAALLHSAALYNPRAQFWLLACALSDANRATIENYALSLNVVLGILDGTDPALEGLPVHRGGSLAMYARLLVPQRLPADVKRALYLDADIIVMRPLDPLFEMDMGGLPLAAVEDFPQVAERRAICLGPEWPYVNSGVLLFDLAAWRDEQIADQIFATSRRLGETTVHRDQSAINATLAGRVKLLSRHWNCMDLKQLTAAAYPAIAHYAGEKPGISPSRRGRNLYMHHRSRTPWRLEDGVRSGLSFKELRRRIAASLGHRRYREIFARRRHDEEFLDLIVQSAEHAVPPVKAL